MRNIEYSYAVLRYVHDPVSEESLNVGVLIFAPAIGFVRARIQHEYGRLSSAFPNFNGDCYRNVARHLESRVNSLMEGGGDSFVLSCATDGSVNDLVASVLPEDDTCLRLTESRAGITSDPSLALDEMYRRYVLRYQLQSKKDCRTDEDVWRLFRNTLAEAEVLPKLRPVTIRGDAFTHEFKYAWENGKWHPLEPLSMDAEKSQTLQDRALRWVGRVTALRKDASMGKVHMLVGKPQLESLRTPYLKALDLLRTMPGDMKIVTEDEAESFAGEFRDLVVRHEASLVT